MRQVEAVLGGSADLPCDILPVDPMDDVYLVLWFKDEATKPMYRWVRSKRLNLLGFFFAEELSGAQGK